VAQDSVDGFQMSTQVLRVLCQRELQVGRLAYLPELTVQQLKGLAVLQKWRRRRRGCLDLVVVFAAVRCRSSNSSSSSFSSFSPAFSAISSPCAAVAIHAAERAPDVAGWVIGCCRHQCHAHAAQLSAQALQQAAEEGAHLTVNVERRRQERHVRVQHHGRAPPRGSSIGSTSGCVSSRTSSSRSSGGGGSRWSTVRRSAFGRARRRSCDGDVTTTDDVAPGTTTTTGIATAITAARLAQHARAS
jgi:hypothetical protein